MNTIIRTRPFPSGTPTGSARLLNATGPGLAAHQAHFGPLPALDGADDLVEMLTQSGLTGRGGAGFPTGRKLATVRAAARASAARTAVVIANGAEGEPASSKDAVLLRSAPHLVLDGLALAASAVGAVQCYLYAPAARLAVLHRAIQERAAAGWGLGIPAPILIEAPEHFLAGEESAAVNAVQGRAAIPSDRTVRVSISGVYRAPTLVQNVETLAHLALIARFGPQWFRWRCTLPGAAKPSPGVYRDREDPAARGLDPLRRPRSVHRAPPQPAHPRRLGLPTGPHRGAAPRNRTRVYSGRASSRATVPAHRTQQVAPMCARQRSGCGRVNPGATSVDRTSAGKPAERLAPIAWFTASMSRRARLRAVSPPSR